MEKEQPDYFPFHPRVLFFYLLSFNFFLTLMYSISILSGSWNLQQWFDLDGEISIPTWYSSSQLLVSGLLILAAIKYRYKGFSPRRDLYLIVGLGLIFLSADETSMIHERLTPLSAKYANFIPLFNGNRGAWITIYGVIFLTIFTSQIKNIVLMWHNYREAFVLFFLGLITLVAGAVLVEITMYYSLLPSAILQVSVEEFLEMVGGSIILISSVVFLSRHVEVRKLVSGDDRTVDQSISHPSHLAQKINGAGTAVKGG